MNLNFLFAYPIQLTHGNRYMICLYIQKNKSRKNTIKLKIKKHYFTIIYYIIFKDS